jgi:hypothetical protein
MRIHIIGIDHGFQRVREVSERFVEPQKRLLICIRKLIGIENITLLAEEYSMEALEKHNDRFTHLQVFSKEFGIRHVFCDPDSAERKSLRILEKNENEHGPREEYWLAKLEECGKDLEGWVVFLCGYDHLQSFRQLCIDSGYDALYERIG